MQEKYVPIQHELTIEHFKNRFNSPETMKDEGEPFLFWLLKQDKGLETLTNEPHCLFQENLNTFIQSVGVTVLWLIASTLPGQKILKRYPELLTQGDLNAAPKQGVYAGKTLLWGLAATPEGLEILAAHPELLSQGNLDAGPEQGSLTGTTVLWLLAVKAEGRQILANNPALLSQKNLNATPEQGAEAGKTVLWLLAATAEGRQILAAHPELLYEGNLNAAPEEGDDAGKTVLWCLAATPEGRKILIEHPELLYEGDLNAAPEQGPDEGASVLWCLAATPEGHQILIENPGLLSRGNLNAAPQKSIYAGKTVLQLLDSTPKGRQVLTAHELLTQTPDVQKLAAAVYPHNVEKEALSQKRKRTGSGNSDANNRPGKKALQTEAKISPPLKRLKSVAAANRSEKVRENDLSIRIYKGGIAPKYLGRESQAKLPTLPAARVGLTALPELSFVPVHRLGSSSSQPHPHHLTSATTWSGYLMSLNESFKPGEINTFICAGRKANALVPPLTEGRCALICTEEELNEVIPYLSATVDILVIRTMNSRYNGDYQDHLSSITARRLAAFLFAFEYDLDRFIILDDNIEKVFINTNGQPAVSWSELFNVLSAHLGEKGSTSVATQNGRPKAPEELGSKFFMINMSRIKALVEQEEHLFLLFPEVAQATKWGEDYYFQIFLDYLFEQDNQPGFGIVPEEDMSLTRSKMHRNKFKSSGVNATSFATTINLEQIPPEFSELVSKTICSLNKLIDNNHERYERYDNFQRRFNLNRSHAAANNTGATAIIAPPVFPDSNDFKTNFYNLINQYDYSKSTLRPYQIEAIKAVATHYQFPSRYLLATGSGKTIIQCTLALMAWHAAMDDESIIIVTPQIELVNQLYEDLIKYNNSLRDKQDPLCISNDAILKISSHPQSVTLKLFIKNECVKNASNIIICCADSFQNLLATDSARVISAALVLFDEYHVYKPVIKEVCETFPEEGPITIASSATPPKNDSIPNTLYTLSLKDALNGPFHAPVVASSLNVDYSKKNARNFLRCLPGFLRGQYHPGFEEEGRILTETKGVVYVQSIKLCNQTVDLLRKANIQAYAIHSKNRDSDAAVKEFVCGQKPGVLVAVRKLRFGFDCKDLAWVIIARKPTAEQPEEDVEQMLGRVVRLDQDKIGYVISFRNVHNQYVIPLVENQTKELRLSKYFLANEMKYSLSDNKKCVVIYPEMEQRNLSSIVFEVLPYTRPAKPDTETTSIPNLNPDLYEEEEEEEAQVTMKTSLPPQTLSFFAPSSPVSPPAKSSQTAYLFKLIDEQKEDELITFLRLTSNRSNTPIPAGQLNEAGKLSSITLMIDDFFSQVPSWELDPLVQCSEGKYFIQLLKACPRIERNKLIISSALNSLWINLNLNELDELIRELKIHHSIYPLAHIVNTLFMRYQMKENEEGVELIPYLQLCWMEESLFYTKRHAGDNEDILYMEGLLEKVKEMIYLEETENRLIM